MTQEDTLAWLDGLRDGVANQDGLAESIVTRAMEADLMYSTLNVIVEDLEAFVECDTDPDGHWFNDTIESINATISRAKGEA